MENFDIVYDSMLNSYATIEKTMGNVYEQIQSNTTDERSKEVLESLGMAAQAILFSQKEFTSSYCEDITMKEGLLRRLDEKESALKEALSSTLTRTR